MALLSQHNVTAFTSLCHLLFLAWVALPWLQWPCGPSSMQALSLPSAQNSLPRLVCVTHSFSSFSSSVTSLGWSFLSSLFNIHPPPFTISIHYLPFTIHHNLTCYVFYCYIFCFSPLGKCKSTKKKKKSSRMKRSSVNRYIYNPVAFLFNSLE